MTHNNTGVTILGILMLSILGVITFMFFKTPYRNMLAFLVPLFLFCAIWVSSEYLPTGWCNPNVITDSGVVGTYSPDEDVMHAGNMMTRYIYMKKKYVPEKIKKDHCSGFRGVTSWLTQNVRIKITTHKKNWIEVPRSYCEAPEGAVRLVNVTLTGTKIPTEHIRLKAENEGLHDKISKIYDITLTAKAISDSEAKENAVSLLHSMQKVGTMLKDVAQKSTVVMPPQNTGQQPPYERF